MFKKRLSDEILKVLESTANKILNDPKIEADWLSFHSLIKVPAEFKVDVRTFSSRDLFKELTQVSLKARSGEMTTGGTRLHDQQDTNFCAYFATMSALRHQLRKTVGTEISGEDTSKKPSEEPEKYAGLEIKEYLKRRDEDEKRFERDLSVMIGCVSPRSLSARFQITFKNIAVKTETKISGDLSYIDCEKFSARFCKFSNFWTSYRIISALFEFLR